MHIMTCDCIDDEVLRTPNESVITEIEARSESKFKLEPAS